MSQAIAYAETSLIEALHAPGSPAVVTATELRRRYGEGDTAVDALLGIDVEIAKGELTAVMGPSGSGKSTLMHLLAGLDQPTAGTVTIDGTEITRLKDAELTRLRRNQVGFVFQFFNLLPMLSAEENVLLPLSIAGEKPDKAWIEELLGRVGLRERRKHRPAELSGGQQQRVAVARALVARPAVVLRRRADRQPRLAHRHRDPRPAQRGGRPTTARRSSWSPMTSAPRPSPTGSSTSPTAGSGRTSAPLPPRRSWPRSRR